MIIQTDRKTRFTRRREILVELLAMADVHIGLESKTAQRKLVLELMELTTIEATLASVRKPRKQKH